MMMDALIRPTWVEHILLDIDIRNREQLFDRVGLHLSKILTLPAGDIAGALLERERYGSTGMGHGVAMPHARLQNLFIPSTLFLRSRLPIPFDAPDDRPVHLFYILLAPEHATQSHLQKLAYAAQLMSDRAICMALSAASCLEDVECIVKPWRPSI